jgi:hypothetical protein
MIDQPIQAGPGSVSKRPAKAHVRLFATEPVSQTTGWKNAAAQRKAATGICLRKFLIFSRGMTFYYLLNIFQGVA